MRKGKLVGLRALPQLNLLDDNGKAKLVEIEGLFLEPLSGFSGEISAYHHLKSYLNQPVEYLPSKKSQHRCKLLDVNGADIGLGLVSAGLAIIDWDDMVNSTLYAPEEIEQFRAAQEHAKSATKAVVKNYIAQNQQLGNTSNLEPLEGEFTLQNIRREIVVSRNDTYLSITASHLNLSIGNIEEEQVEEFIKRFRTLRLRLARPVLLLPANLYVVKAELPSAMEEDILRRGWADLSLEAEVDLPDQVYQRLDSARQEAVKAFRGMWSNPVDIFETVYTKDNFLGVPVQIDEGNVFLMQNLETGQYQSIEIHGVTCPQNEEIGAYESREFSRKQALGQEFNVYVLKDLGFRQVASLVRLSDGERYSKLLIRNGWATIVEEKDAASNPQFTRLLELQRKCSAEKVGLFSNKLGKVRFEDLTKQPTKEAKEHLRGLYGQFTNSIHEERKLVPGVIVGSKKNNVLSVLLKEYRVIINIELEGVSVLDFKLVLKEYDQFKEESARYLRDNIVQRDVEIEVVDLNQSSCSLIGYVYLGDCDVAELLLRQGLLCCAGGFGEHENRSYSQSEEEARSRSQGMWTAVLSRLKSSNEISLLDRPFKATISEIVDGSSIYYQTEEALSRLDREVALLLEKGLEKRLEKHHIKVGNLCAAPFTDGQLYRARILSQRKKGDKVWVLFVDYGNKMRIDQDQLRQLPEELMKIEELAKKTRLFLVKKLNLSIESKAACLGEIEQLALNKEFIFVPVGGGIFISNAEAVLLYEQEPADNISKSTNVQIISEGLAKLDASDLSTLPIEQEQHLKDISAIARSEKNQYPSVWLQLSDQDEIKKELGDL